MQPEEVWSSLVEAKSNLSFFIRLTEWMKNPTWVEPKDTSEMTSEQLEFLHALAKEELATYSRAPLPQRWTPVGHSCFVAGWMYYWESSGSPFATLAPAGIDALSLSDEDKAILHSEAQKLKRLICSTAEVTAVAEKTFQKLSTKVSVDHPMITLFQYPIRTLREYYDKNDLDMADAAHLSVHYMTDYEAKLERRLFKLQEKRAELAAEEKDILKCLADFSVSRDELKHLSSVATEHFGAVRVPRRKRT